VYDPVLKSLREARTSDGRIEMPENLWAMIREEAETDPTY